jgi:hypothetical protein
LLRGAVVLAPCSLLHGRSVGVLRVVVSLAVVHRVAVLFVAVVLAARLGRDLLLLLALVVHGLIDDVLQGFLELFSVELPGLRVLLHGCGRLWLLRGSIRGREALHDGLYRLAVGVLLVLLIVLHFGVVDAF